MGILTPWQAKYASACLVPRQPVGDCDLLCTPSSYVRPHAVFATL